MPYMSGAEAMVKLLVQEGVDVIFGIPGVQTVDAVDAIYRNGHIRWISPRHEQTAAYMALGYAMTTGKIGVAMVLPGPGALNITAAIGTAYATSAPVLVISGQVESLNIGFHRGVLHELDEQLDIFRPITKYAARAVRAEDIPDLVAQALKQLKTQRPRPAFVEVPYDLWAKEAEMAFPGTERYPPIPPDGTEIERAVAILTRARRPLILAGRGAVKAEVGGEIRALAERLHAPVIMTPEAQGLVPVNHPFYGGNFFLWRNPIFARADAVLVIGSRLRASGNSRLELRPTARVIQVDCDSGELGRNHRIDLGISADAKLTLKAILESLGSRSASLWKEDQIARVRISLRRKLEDIAPLQVRIIDSIHGAIGDEGIIVPDITNIGYYCDLAYPVNRPCSYVDSAYFGTLGFAFPTALGAKVAHPGRPVVAVCGDGGFAYASAELATAVQEKINTIAIIFRDDAYGTVTNIQRRQFGARFIGNRLHNPDYVRFARAFGAAGMRAKTPRELGKALSQALAADQPVLIDVPVPPLEEPWAVLG
ncbi:MAG: thiamine pyrophosphate-binding protein [Dehalococcoidales bacterium]|nr:thiamine pyrophosphate-binding protein [Dehalococcoidales bacterium]